MKTCAKCNSIFELSNFYYIEKRNYTDNYCKDCRKLDWKIKRLIREQKLIQQGYNSIHNYRVKEFANYREYCKIRSSTYNKKFDKPRKKKHIDSATDYYIRELIRKDKSMKGMQIPQELIDLYRNNLLLKRQLNNGN